MSDLHARIADLERRIEVLSARAERCRQVELGAKGTILAGCALLALMTFGIVHFTAALWVICIAGSLGGVVLYGANRSTLQQILAAIRALEANRAEMIDRIAPRTVETGWREISLPQPE